MGFWGVMLILLSFFFSYLSAVVERISRIVKDYYTLRLFLWVGIAFIASLGCLLQVLS